MYKATSELYSAQKGSADMFMYILHHWRVPNKVYLLTYFLVAYIF